MTITQLFDKFLKGEALPNLPGNIARSLLDLARSKLLSRGIKTAEPAAGGDAVKAALLEAHRQLTGAEFYAMSKTSDPQDSLTPEQLAAIMHERERTGDSFAEIVSRVIGGITATAKPAARPTAAAAAPPATPAQLAKIRELETRLTITDRKIAVLKPKLAALEARNAARLAAPAPGTRPAPARPPARPAPAPAPAPITAPASFAAKMTAGAARQIAAAIVDETEARRAASLQKTRGQFDLLTTREKGAFFKNGGKLID